VFPPQAPSPMEVFHQLWMYRIWAFVIALLLSLLLTPLFRWLALRRGIVDRPDHAVKIHAQPIPYLGGGAIWLAWTVSVLVYHAIADVALTAPRVALLAGGTVAFLTGLAHDLRDIRPRIKLLGQAVAGAILLAGGIRWLAYPSQPWLPELNMPEDSWFVFAVCLGVHFAIVIGGTNATNLLDGLDGLCSGVAAIVSIGFLLLATSLTAWANPEWYHQPVAYEYTQLAMSASFALAGAVIGFLPYNFNPARIFMGDAGSIFIGYILAAMMIMFSSRFGVAKWFIGALFIFGLPIFDTGMAVIRRLLNRRPIMMPDCSHLYNQLVDRLHLSVRAAVAILYGLSALFAAAGLLVLYLPGRYAAILYMLTGLVFLAIVWRLGFFRMTEEEKAAADRYLAVRRGESP